MRFHVYALKQPKSPTTPYVLDLQNNLLDGLNSRVVAPLRQLSTQSKGELIQDLMPVLDVGGKKYVLVTQEIASFPVSQMERGCRFNAGQFADHERAGSFAVQLKDARHATIPIPENFTK